MKPRHRNILFNASARFSGNVLSNLLGLFALPFITRALGPTGYGRFNLILVIISYVTIFANWGFITFGTREVADRNDTADVVNTIISARLTLSILSILIFLLISPFIFKDIELLILIIIALGTVLAQLLSIDFYYYGKKKLAIPTFCQLFGQIVYVIGVVFFVKKAGDLKNLLILYVVYQNISSILMLTLYARKNELKVSFSVRNSFQMLKKTFILGASNRIENLVTSYPVLIIPLFLSQYELGLYSSAFKFFSIILLIYSTIMLTIAPHLVDLRKKDVYVQRKTIFLLLGSLFIIGLLTSGLFLITGETILRLLFGKSFGPAAPLINLVSYYMIPFWPVAMVLGTILIYYGFEKYYLKSIIFMGIIILILTPILIKIMGVGGSIYSIGISNISLMIIEAFYLRKLVPGLISLKKLN